MAGIEILKAGYKLSYFKGEYYSVSAEKARGIGRRLIYPMNNAEGMIGIHSVLDVDGRVRLGPYFYPCVQLNYSIDDTNKPSFYSGARRLFPHIGYDDIEPESTGIVPRVFAAGQPFRDFVIKDEGDSGFPGFINLIGIESPGLTSSPVIADSVADLLQWPA